MHLTFLLLGLAIGAVWLRDLALPSKMRVPPWCLVFFAALCEGFRSGCLQWPSLLPLAGLGLLCYFHRRSSKTGTASPSTRSIADASVVVIAVALALHLFPGFDNPRLLSDVHVSVDAPPFTQYLNFDKGAAGLLLLAAYCRRFSSLAQVRLAAGRIAMITLIACGAVIGLALVMGYVRPDLKFPSFAFAFLATNLFFTVVAEEALFRGLLQRRMAVVLRRFPASSWLPAALSGAIFGLAHFSGGLPLVVLATVAGCGYGVVYARTRRIEASIFAHFAVNAVQFIGFTYPHLAK
jgi:membrane protease YdiL (CAAX protease family)